MYWWGIPVSLLILAAFGASMCRAMVSAPLILFVNWLACTAMVYATGDDYPVMFFMVADYAAALALFFTRRSHWQSAIMAIYAIQLICHGAYALSAMTFADRYYSYWALTYMAWAQVALVGGWIGTEFIGRWLHISSRGRGEADNPAVVAREAE